MVRRDVLNGARWRKLLRISMGFEQTVLTPLRGFDLRIRFWPQAYAVRLPSFARNAGSGQLEKFRMYEALRFVLCSAENAELCIVVSHLLVVRMR